MSDHDNARRAPMHYMAAARAYCFDLVAMAFLFVSVSILAGRVWRFPFDDEIATLTKIEPDTARELVATFPATDDIHPPFSYLLFYGLRQLDFSDAAMRLCSLLLTFLALALCHSLVLRWLSSRADAGTLPSPTRIVAVLIFGLMPLAVSQGDALRWYPVFAVLIALFLVLYLEPRDEWQRLWSGVALGLAASTDFSAALIVPPFLFYRHVLQRRFRWSFDLTYWLIVPAGAAIGFWSAYYIFTYRIQAVRTEFSGGVIRSVLTDVLGFFGGDALGISQAWIVLPLVIVFALAAIGEIDRQKPGKPVHLLLLVLSAPVLMALAGFATPRSFLYLTPVTAALITMFFHRQLRQGHVRRAIAVVAITLVTSVAAIANLISGTHPFKRNSVVPYQAIFDFIDHNANGSALVISTDPVVPWVLRAAGKDRCAGYFFDVKRCLESGRLYDSIFVVFGHNDRSDETTLMNQFKAFVDETTAGRTKLASLPAGHDADAALKTRLTGVPLDAAILTVDFYR
jgi:hypothetical protein